MLQLCFDTHPVLTTPRLVLRQADERDIPQFFTLRSDKETMRYIPRPLAQTYQDIKTLLQVHSDITVAGDGITWAITLKTDPAFIGHIGFYRTSKENHRSEIGYLLHPDFRGRGIMQEAVKAALHFGFHTMGFHSVEGVVHPDNLPSINVLERAGFTREGYFNPDFAVEYRIIDLTD